MSVLLLLLVIYSLACMLIAVKFLPDSKIAELIYYPIVGIIWIFPAMKIVKWMQSSE
jgi:peptidoglycan/LPS O-acetylase OafA/YrhL